MMRARFILHGNVTAVVKTDGRTADFELNGKDMGFDAIAVRGGAPRKLGGFTAGHAGPFDIGGAEAYAVVERKDGRIVARGGDDGGVDWTRVRVALASMYQPPVAAPKPVAQAEPAATKPTPPVDIPAGARVFGFAVGDGERVESVAAIDMVDGETGDEEPEDTQRSEYERDTWTQADAEDMAQGEQYGEPEEDTEDTDLAEESAEGYMPEPVGGAVPVMAAAEPMEDTDLAEESSEGYMPEPADGAVPVMAAAEPMEDTDLAEESAEGYMPEPADGAVPVMAAAEPMEDTDLAEESPEGYMPEPAGDAVPVMAEGTSGEYAAKSREGWQGGTHPQARMTVRRNADGRRVAPFEGTYAQYDWVLVEQGRGHYLSGTKRGGSAIAIPGRYAPVVPERLMGFNDFAYARDGSGYWIKVFSY